MVILYHFATSVLNILNHVVATLMTKKLKIAHISMEYVSRIEEANFNVQIMIHSNNRISNMYAAPTMFSIDDDINGNNSDCNMVK